MDTIPIFDFNSCPMEGTCLIEASAGTGKTYTITGLFLKLLIEKQLSIDQILIVTFTEAATEELKHKIRKLLKNARQALSEKCKKNQEIYSIIRACDDRDFAKKYLEYAINNFDESAIYTIHGFCHRMLSEHAFESGNRFDMEIEPDSDLLAQHIIEDFWRKNLYTESPLFIQFCIEHKATIESMINIAKKNLIHPFLSIIPQVETYDTRQEENQFLVTFRDVRSLWEISKDDVITLMKNTASLNGNSYRKDYLMSWVEELDDYLAPPSPEQIGCSHFQKFTSDHIREQTRKGFSPLSHPFFNLCQKHQKAIESLKTALNRRLVHLKFRLIEFFRKEIRQRHQHYNTQSYDDLLVNLRNALNSSYGYNLAENIRKKYKAVLIDEFQDTDSIQYDIFKTIFDQKGCILYYIGDPKQAIYGFRGADIFAYMEAAKSVQTRFTLTQNWRSESGLVQSINSIFQNSDHPFIYHDIPFHIIHAAPNAPFDRLTEKGNQTSHFHLWILDTGISTNGTEIISATDARRIIASKVACEIISLLNRAQDNRLYLGKNPLFPKDIAILVRSHHEADVIYQTLNKYQIPAVLYNTGNLFKTIEAAETERILTAIVESDHINFVKAALATDMIGLTGESFELLMNNETFIEEWCLKLKRYSTLWNRLGFIRMFKEFLYQEQVLLKLMRFPDGERRTTNILHLAEILHMTSIEKKFDGIRLVRWLSEQRNSDSVQDETYLLRLESDADAVKIVTVHKSKGLEYPVVFCPFTWGGINQKEEPFLMFHNPDNPKELVLDLGSDQKEQHLDLVKTETLAENLRLLYVALTRAKNRCYMVWGLINKSDTSAPSFLFHFPNIRNNFAHNLSQNFKTLTKEQVVADIEKIQKRSENSIEISIISDSSPSESFDTIPTRAHTITPNLSSRKFSGQIDSSFRITSFSSLVSFAPSVEELADHDPEIDSTMIRYIENDSQPCPSENTSDSDQEFFSFPRGATAGSFVHDLLQHLDFSQPNSAVTTQLIENKLTEYHYDPIWVPAVQRMIQHLVSLPLGDNIQPFTLSDISLSDRLNELEFYYPIQPITSQKLLDIFKQYLPMETFQELPEQIGRLQFSPVRGYLKGFIDLVFRYNGKYYLVDWKSNFLGNDDELYHIDNLHSEMIRNYYTLQYYLYLVALDKYLQLREPNYQYNTHFGEVYYMFLRGIHPDKGNTYGVYRDRPSEKIIRTLSETLLDVKVEK